MNCWTWMIVALTFVAAPALADDKKCVLQMLGELPVTMEGTQPLITGTINGKPARFLADSGAFFSMLSPASAEKFGLRLHAMPGDFRVVGTGGSTQVRRAQVAKFTLTGLGDGYVYERVDFLVGATSLDTHVDGLIGQNVFRIADTEYDLANGFLRLMRPKDCKGQVLAYWAGGKPVGELEYRPTSPLQPHLVVTAKLNGTTIRVMLDSGAASSVLTVKAAARAGIEPEDDGVTAAGLSMGIGKRARENSIARFEMLDLGGEIIKNARLRMADISLDDVDMLLGADFFLSHRMYVDPRERKIYFTYNGGPVFDLRPRDAAPTQSQTPPGADAVSAAATGTSASDAFAPAEMGDHAESEASAAAATKEGSLDAASLRRRGAASAGRISGARSPISIVRSSSIRAIRRVSTSAVSRTGKPIASHWRSPTSIRRCH